MGFERRERNGKKQKKETGNWFSTVNLFIWKKNCKVFVAAHSKSFGIIWRKSSMEYHWNNSIIYHFIFYTFCGPLNKIRWSLRITWPVTCVFIHYILFMFVLEKYGIKFRCLFTKFLRSLHSNWFLAVITLHLRGIRKLLLDLSHSAYDFL